MPNLDLSAQILYEDGLIPLEQRNHQEHGIISLPWMLTKRALKFLVQHFCVMGFF